MTCCICHQAIVEKQAVNNLGNKKMHKDCLFKLSCLLVGRQIKINDMDKERLKNMPFVHVCLICMQPTVKKDFRVTPKYNGRAYPTRIHRHCFDGLVQQ